MKQRQPRTISNQPAYRYRAPNVPLSAIRRFARRLGERFKPDRIVLFGSYAYGRLHAESDVDLLVIMPAANRKVQAVRMSLAFEAPFSLDLIVRTPEQLRRGLEEEDWFLREIVARGKVVYEKKDGPVGSQGGGRPRRRASADP